MKIRKSIMVLVLGSLFMGVSYADNNVWVDVNTTSKVKEIDKSTWDDDIDSLFAEIDEITKQTDEYSNQADEYSNQADEYSNQAEAYKKLRNTLDELNKVLKEKGL